MSDLIDSGFLALDIVLSDAAPVSSDKPFPLPVGDGAASMPSTFHVMGPLDARSYNIENRVTFHAGGISGAVSYHR